VVTLIIKKLEKNGRKLVTNLIIKKLEKEKNGKIN